LHQENVERSTPNVQYRIQHSVAEDGGHYSSVALDETDVAAAFETGGFDFRYVISLGIETQILLQIVIGNKIAPHRLTLQLAIFDNDRGRAFDNFAKRMEATGDPAEKTMQKNENEAATDRSEKAGGAIDRA